MASQPQLISVNHGYDLRSGTTTQHTNTNRLLRTDRFITLSTRNLFADIVVYIAAFCIFSGLFCNLADATRLKNKH